MGRLVECILGPLLVLAAFATMATARSTRQVDQGPDWSPDARTGFYHVEQGSRMIPLLWLKALRTTEGQPFLADALTRYGFLRLGPKAGEGLPIGFTSADTPRGQVVGMTCAACHVREIKVGDEAFRIDGAPAFIDFGMFIKDLDDAVGRVLANDGSFLDFSTQVLGPAATDPGSRATLKAEVEAWSVRFHTWTSLSLPKVRAWGPARLDAMGMIFNRVAGLDVGVPPSYLIPDNIARADAPVRYPFLWNSAKQDFTQWAAFDPNGNDTLALVRNLGQLYGVFGEFHPQAQAGAAAPLNRDYLSQNSANFGGLGAAEALLKRIGPPRWPWAVDRAMAERGGRIFQRDCAQCHGVEEGAARPPVAHTWKTRILDAGTDTRQWDVLTRQVQTGSMEGAFVPGSPPLKARDGALATLRVAILGALLEKQAPPRRDDRPVQDHPAPAPASSDGASGAMPKMGEERHAMALTSSRNVYEARVLQGVWAAAPFLHNGSVPTLADLLEPPDLRPRTFQIGPIYDPDAVGLSRKQDPKAFALSTTGCEDRASGDSNCGHAYGTALPAAEKRALLEYLKTL